MSTERMDRRLMKVVYATSGNYDILGYCARIGIQNKILLTLGG